MTIEEAPRDLSPVESPKDPYKRIEIYYVAWVFYLILAIIGLIWIGFSQGSVSIYIFLDPEDWGRDVGVGVLAGLILVSVWDLGKKFIPELLELETVLARHIGPLEPSEALILALISGFSEELFFRGAIQYNWGWAWSIVIFTLMHSGPGRVFRWWTAFAFVAALVFVGLTYYRGTILAAIVAHVVVNAINLRRLATASFFAKDE